MNNLKNINVGDTVLCDEGGKKEQGEVRFISDDVIRIDLECSEWAHTFNIGPGLVVTKIYPNHIKLDDETSKVLGNKSLHSCTAELLGITLVDGDQVRAVHHYQVITSFSQRPIATMPTYPEGTEQYKKLPMLVTKDTWRPDLNALIDKYTG